MRLAPISAALLLLLLPALPAAADYAAGEKAFDARDFATAWKELKPLADAGDARAMEGVGCMLLDGNGVKADPAAARAWFEKSVAAGNLDACCQLGFLYTEGLGVAKDPVKAFACYLKAAKNDNFMAQSIAAALYYGGIGTPRDPGKALRWFLIAADNPAHDPAMREAALAKIGEITKALPGARVEAARKWARMYRDVAKRKPIAIDKLPD